MPFWVLGAQLLDIDDVVVWIARQWRDVECNAIAHTNDTELRDRVLLEELGDEGIRIAKREKISRRPQILFSHSIG